MANGTYNVEMHLGDPGPYAHDQMGIFLEGIQVDTVATAASEVVTRTYAVSVTDGQLTVDLIYLGGNNRNVVIEALVTSVVVVDTTPPVVTLTAPALTNNAKPSLTVSATDTGSGVPDGTTA